MCSFILNVSDWIYKANLYKVNFLASFPNVHRLGLRAVGQANTDNAVSIWQMLLIQQERFSGQS